MAWRPLIFSRKYIFKRIFASESIKKNRWPNPTNRITYCYVLKLAALKILKKSCLVPDEMNHFQRNFDFETSKYHQCHPLWCWGAEKNMSLLSPHFPPIFSGHESGGASVPWVQKIAKILAAAYGFKWLETMMEKIINRWWFQILLESSPLLWKDSNFD